MSQETWNAVDDYLLTTLFADDPDLDWIIEKSKAEGLPEINVSPCHGKLLHLIATIHGSSRILEIGTLGGYSAVWLAMALPENGRLITLESIPRYAAVAAGNIERAGFSDKVRIHVGDALKSLPVLHEEQTIPFDMIFIDADKTEYPEYLDWAIKLSRPGSIVVMDNMVRDGAIIDPASEDDFVKGVQQTLDFVKKTPRLSATAIQTVGLKGYDGFLIAVVSD